MCDAVYDTLDSVKGRTVTDVANLTGISNPAVHRFLRLLVGEEMALERVNPKRRCYVYFKMEKPERRATNSVIQDAGGEAVALN